MLDEAGIFLIRAVGVHVALSVCTLEMETDVVEGGVGLGEGLFVVVAPQFAPCVHHRSCLSGEYYGLSFSHVFTTFVKQVSRRSRAVLSVCCRSNLPYLLCLVF